MPAMGALFASLAAAISEYVRTVLGASQVAAVVAAYYHLSLAWSLVVVALAPVVTIVGYEAVGHRHMQDHLSKLRA